MSKASGVKFHLRPVLVDSNEAESVNSAEPRVRESPHGTSPTYYYGDNAATNAPLDEAEVLVVEDADLTGDRSTASNTTETDAKSGANKFKFFVRPQFGNNEEKTNELTRDVGTVDLNESSESKGESKFKFHVRPLSKDDVTPLVKETEVKETDTVKDSKEPVDADEPTDAKSGKSMFKFHFGPVATSKEEKEEANEENEESKTEVVEPTPDVEKSAPQEPSTGKGESLFNFHLKPVVSPKEDKSTVEPASDGKISSTEAAPTYYQDDAVTNAPIVNQPAFGVTSNSAAVGTFTIDEDAPTNAPFDEKVVAVDIEENNMEKNEKKGKFHFNPFAKKD